MKLREILNESSTEKDRNARITELSLALEHQTYKNILGTQNSYRQDPANTNTHTQKHAHVYARPNGNGKQLYSINVDGSGHDGSSGTVIPLRHAEFFRSLGYTVPLNLALESLDFSELASGQYEICILNEDL
ncbi:hypothetical protein [Paraburkholderia aspalathi]|uniref:hypothetical protein n=1 Tax=Paraburkholderia aspalathi TaxID=1324617 RepID=UPI001B275DF9|nr:hypothetical protein [Paraburkholderia aspalathi]CAE6837409.1 hypothetical protein R20943_06938 [Paraburkholderia aspalathi]